MFINSFLVLLTGKYWEHAYWVTLGLLRLSTKISFYMGGLTDKHPGISLSINDNFSFDIPYPEKSSRFYTVPVFGGLVRWILLIPYAVFIDVI